jgi:NAD-dependent dihydropyrimidine dehydrogenase PreA subunit
METLVYLSNVVTLQLDKAKCNGCALCTIVCPHRVFVMEQKKAAITNINKCMECGACAKNCASGAITVAAGVGCASAILSGMIKGTEPQCGCDCSN